MKTSEKAIALIGDSVQNACFLEVACGCAELSLAASKFVASVDCIDLDEFRLLPAVIDSDMIHFQKMDATKMTFQENSFDIVALYNAVQHLGDILAKVIRECVRVVKPGGSIWLISTFSMDKPIMKGELQQILISENLPFNVLEQGKFYCVHIEKSPPEKGL